MESFVRSRTLALGALVAGAVLVAGCSAGASSTASEPDAAPHSQTDPSSQPSSEPPLFGASGAAPVKIEAGTHTVPASAWSVADFTVTFPEGWSEQYGHVFAMNPDKADEAGFYPIVVDEIFADACGPNARVVKVGPTVGDLVNALYRQKGPDLSAPHSVRLAGMDAVRIDYAVPSDLDLDTCRLAQDGVDGLQIWRSEAADKYFVLTPDARYSVYILLVDGRRQVFLTQYREATSREDRAELADALATLTFE